MEIGLDSKTLWYKVYLTSCIGTRHSLTLSSTRYVDIQSKHKRAQFLFNETKNMIYNLDTNELEIWFHSPENTIKIQFDSTNPKHSLYTPILRSLFSLKGTIHTQTSDINENIKDIDLRYFSIIYLILFGETTYCDDIYLNEKEEEENDID